MSSTTPPHAEGRANLVDTGDGIFFNAKQTLQRDLTIICLREALSRCDSPLILDALCGCGVRAIRYALEVPGARLHANDSSERCVDRHACQRRSERRVAA